MPPKRNIKCFVPSCENVDGCGKIFLHTPRNPEINKSWCAAVGTTTGGKCCEDHFVLAEDAENWQYFKLCGSGLKIKKGVVPHKYLTSMCPDKGSQFSDEDKKIKLEFMSSLVNERKIVTRVNRLEDLKVAGESSNPTELEELAKNNARLKHNAPYIQYMEPKPDTLQVTPDIYICSCVHDQPVTHDADSDHRNPSFQTADTYVQVVLGPTTGDPGSDDRPSVPAATGSKKKPKKVAPVVESEEEVSESDVSLLDGDYSDVDPDYDPDSDGGGGDEDRDLEELPLSEVREDDLMKTAMKTETRTSSRRTSQRKCARKMDRKSVKATAKSATTKKNSKNSVKSKKSKPRSIKKR